MVDAMNNNNFKQPITHDLKKKHITNIEAKYSNKNK
jgi:hypothetical protein